VPPPTRRCPAQWLLRGRRNVASLCYGLITSLVPAPSIGSVVTVCGKCAALGSTTTMSLQQQSKSQRIVGIAMQRKSRQVKLESQPTLRPPTLSKTNTAAGESLDSSAEDSSRQQNEVRAKYKPNVGAYTRRIIAGGGLGCPSYLRTAPPIGERVVYKGGPSTQNDEKSTNAH